MFSFKEFIAERRIDPVELASRAARIYGSKPYRSGHMKVAAGDHIPFSKVAHPSQVSSAVAKYDKVGDKVKETKRSFAISDLHATQHHASVADKDRLKAKVSNKNPDHIHVITHKGKHFVSDGHNAIMAAKLRGDKHVVATHTDLDAV